MKVQGVFGGKWCQNKENMCLFIGQVLLHSCITT